MARRLRQVIDLYATGKVVTLRDGSPVWVQPLNPFEQDTARNEAQIARARLTMAIKEYGSTEQEKVRMYFFEDGPAGAAQKLVDAKVASAMPKVLDSIRNDPEWIEKLLILERGIDDTAKPLEPAESELIADLTGQYTREVAKRLTDEREFQDLNYDDAGEDALWADYLDWYLDRRGTEVMMAEFRLHQIYFGVRVCEGARVDLDTWDHSACDSHVERLFVDKEEVRSAPEELQALFMDAIDDQELAAREAKNSDRQGSSYDSSPLPSEPAESTASIPDETPVAPPGSSSSPLVMPSPSWAGAS